MLKGVKKQICVYVYCFLVLFIAGTAYSHFAPLILRLQADPRMLLTADEISWIISLGDLGGVLSPILAIYLADKYDKRKLIMAMIPLYIIGWLMLTFFQHPWVFFFVRVLHGFSNGVTLTVVPIYMAEIVELSLRQKLSGTLQSAFYFGVLFSYALCPLLSNRVFAYACMPLPVVIFSVTALCPASLIYLLKKGKEREVRAILTELRDSPNIDDELDVIRKNSEHHWIFQSYPSWTGVERRSFLILLTVSATKILTGMPVLMNYPLEIFSIARFPLNPTITSVIITAVMSFVSIFSVALHRRFRLREIVIVSCFGLLVSDCLSGVFLYLIQNYIRSSWYFWVLLISLALYSVFAALGLNIMAHQFSVGSRSSVAAFNNSFSSLLSFFVQKMFYDFDIMEGFFVNYWLYSAFGLIAAFVTACVLRKKA